MVWTVTSAMYICCNVLNYYINSSDSRDVHILLKEKNHDIFIKGKVGVLKLVRLVIFILSHGVKVFMTNIFRRQIRVH